MQLKENQIRVFLVWHGSRDQQQIVIIMHQSYKEAKWLNSFVPRLFKRHNQETEPPKFVVTE